MKLRDSFLALPVVASAAMPVHANAEEMHGTLGMLISGEKLQSNPKPGVDEIRYAEGARICAVVDRAHLLDWKPCIEAGVISYGFNADPYMHLKLLAFYADVGEPSGLGVEWNAGYMRHRYRAEEKQYRYRALTGSAGIHYRGPEYYFAVGTQFTAGAAGRPLQENLLDGDGSIQGNGPWWRPAFDADLSLRRIIQQNPSALMGGVYFEFGGVIDPDRWKKRRSKNFSSWPLYPHGR